MPAVTFGKRLDDNPSPGASPTRRCAMSASERQQIEAIITRLSTRPAQSFGEALAAWAHQAKQ